MRGRTLAALAIIFVPGALVVAGLVAAWRYVFHDEDVLTGATMRRIRAAADRAARLRELDEIPRGRRTALDGPRSTPSALSRPWGDPR
jgi:hypothetical protein